ncbi:MAG: hypothetical protein WKF79_05535 [Nocardioides sp.]
MVLALDGITLAHGVGGQKDLPISLGLAITGAVAALIVSFTVLAVAWRTPRYDAATSGRPAPVWLDVLVGSMAFRVLLRVLGFVVFGYTMVVAILGQNLLTNPLFGLFYVWLWVGLVPMSLLFGSFWKAISPVRTINSMFAKISGSDPEQGVYIYPAWLGYWPAVLGLYAFVWIELVYPFATEQAPVRLWLAAYVAVMLIGGALFGNTWYERADPFEVYSTLIGKLSIWARREGRLLVRSPLANLDTVEARPGLVAVVGVLFGSTVFDSFRESPSWVQFIQSSEVSLTLLNNLALLTFCAGATLILVLGCVLTGVDRETRRRALPGLFAHSVVPIILGYVIAHYLTYFIEVGQRTLILASDPFSDGSNYLGTGDWKTRYWLIYEQGLVANIKVAAVVVGHVVGVTTAHDRAVKLLPRRHQLTGQLPLLVAMIVFTAGGLYLLFSA